MASSFITMKTKLSETLFLEISKNIAEDLAWKFVHEEDNMLEFKIPSFLGIGGTKVQIYMIGDNINFLAELPESDINNRKIATFFVLYQKAEMQIT